MRVAFAPNILSMSCALKLHRIKTPDRYSFVTKRVRVLIQIVSLHLFWTSVPMFQAKEAKGGFDVVSNSHINLTVVFVGTVTFIGYGPRICKENEKHRQAWNQKKNRPMAHSISTESTTKMGVVPSSVR